MAPVYYTRYVGRTKDVKKATVQDLLFGRIDFSQPKTSETITTLVDKESIKNKFDITSFAKELAEFNQHYGNTVISYKTYMIPKKTGGFREINDPNQETRECLKALQEIFTKYCEPCYNNAAYAYIKNRKTVDALKVHQNNKSNWYMKTDFRNFFGSITKKSLLTQLKKIAPFCYISNSEELSKALDKCFYHGKLPQGSPMSPMLTNLLMIPFDTKITKIANSLQLKYIRYCDDTIITSEKPFDKRKIIKLIEQAIAELELPLTLKNEKIRYGSRLGRNWNLGLMTNVYNDITVGHKNKKIHKARLHHLIMAYKKGEAIDKKDLSYARGISAYYRSVEPNYFDYINHWFEEKYNIKMKDVLYPTKQ